MNEILKRVLVESYKSLDRRERDDGYFIDLMIRLNVGGVQVPTPLAPITAPATAVAVPATRRHAAVDPQPVAVVAPALFHAAPLVTGCAVVLAFGCCAM